MNKEVLFAQTLEQVRKTAKEQGNCISEEQVKEAFAELDLSNEQLQMVFDYLLKHKIGIGQPMDPDEFLTEEEKDYLQEYLDEVAALPTYSDGEKLAFSIAAMAGETDAQQRLIELHLADVAEIAKLYAGHAEDEGGVHSTTAEDLAKIMRYCIMTSGEKETFLEVTRTKEYQFQDTDRKRTFSCHNHNAFLDMMDGALSGKTGFTAEAG